MSSVDNDAATTETNALEEIANANVILPTENDYKPTAEDYIKLRLFIQMIHDIIKKRKYCFVSGSFVAHDPENILYEFLKKSKTDTRSGLTISHAILLKKGKENLEKYNAASPANIITIDTNLYENYIKGKNTRDTSELLTRIICKCNNTDVGRDIRTMKWYQFLGDDNQKYIFFKLENWATPDWIKHGWSAFKTYVLGLANTTQCPSFRENCHEFKGEKIWNDKTDDFEREKSFFSSKNGIPKNDKGCIPENVREKVFDLEPANYGRVGDEHFFKKDQIQLILNQINSNIKKPGGLTRQGTITQPTFNSIEEEEAANNLASAQAGGTKRTTKKRTTKKRTTKKHTTKKRTTKKRTLFH